jgi:hypothetical protein
MKNTGVTKGEITVLDKNKELLELYALWKSLPVSILGRMDEKMLYEQFGIDDPQILMLCGIQSQGDFGKKYGVHINTLTDWNKIITGRDPLYEVKGWARTLTKNMMLSMYNHGVRKGNPLLYKLFFQVVNDWEESSKVKLAPGAVTFVFDRIKKPEALVEKPKKAKVVKEK